MDLEEKKAQPSEEDLFATRGGVERKQPFGSFSPDVSVLTMTRDSFATLFRVIHALATDRPEILFEPLTGRVVSEARSMLGEFADHTYGPHYEKY